MIQDAEIFAEGDRKIKERADAKNDFETSVVSARDASYLVLKPMCASLGTRIRCEIS